MINIKQTADIGDGFVNEDGKFLDNYTFQETASTAANVKPYGVTFIESTAAKAYTLTAPVKGARKTIIKTANSTAIGTITVGTTANGISVGGSTSPTRSIAFNGQNDSIELLGTSATKWQIVSLNSVTLS